MFRRIFVSNKQVGLCLNFHDVQGINHLFNVVKKSTNHDTYGNMTKSKVQWWYDNLRYVALQMFEADGDVLLCCVNGRTRSPMYLVAYLVIIYNMTTVKAKGVVATLLQDSRGLIFDRYDSLTPLIELIEKT